MATAGRSCEHSLPKLWPQLPGRSRWCALGGALAAHAPGTPLRVRGTHACAPSWWRRRISYFKMRREERYCAHVCEKKHTMEKR